jgi:DNA-binding NarL/FixJ family response regulator
VNERVRVVIADDHVPLRAGVRAALEEGGFVVCAEASSGPAAVAAAVRERPDVCLLDIHMPGGGIEAAAEITAAVPETTVIMLTVSRSDADLFDALQAGARGYLLKDMEPARLPAALRSAVAGEAALPRALVARLVDEFRGRGRKGAFGLPRRRPDDLTSREWEVLDCMGEGLSTRQIAERLFLSDITVRRHVSAILRKLRVGSRDEAVRLAKERSGNLIDE